MLNIMLLVFLTVMLSIGVADAQFEVVGTDLCHCQPAEISFRFALLSSCLDTTVAVSPGVDDVFCSTEGSAKMLSTIDRVEIFEIDAKAQDISSVLITGPFRDGDTISYSAIANSSWSSFTAQNMPRGIRMAITASDGDGQQKVNSWKIMFDGNCDGKLAYIFASGFF